VELPGVSEELLHTLQSAVNACDVKRFALVGGAVRDALLRRHNRLFRGRLPDLDFVVEGDAELVARYLRKVCGERRVRDLIVHNAYGTAEFVLDGFLIDLASARQEYYPNPGLNPVVTPGTLESDLSRRDFTVNAMALELPQKQLLDCHGGQVDLVNKQLSFLHEASAVEDPTRIVRAARYGARLGFHLAPDALAQVESTIALWPWAWRFGDSLDSVPPALGTRLRMELELLLDLEPSQEALKLLQQWSAMPLFDDGLQRELRLSRRLVQAQRLGLPALSALVAAASDPVSLALRLQIPRRQQIWLEAFTDLRCWLELEVQCQPWSQWDAWEWTQRLEQKHWPHEAVALAVLDNSQFRRPLLRWWGRWRHVRSPLSASDLIAQGVRPGLALGNELQRRREQALRKMR